jgi:hypothetical protein
MGLTQAAINHVMHVFHHVVMIVQDSANIFTTGRLPDVNPP